MSDYLHISIENVKNIIHAEEDFPFQKGLYALVGENGCGKSTLMLALSLTIKKSNSQLFSENDIDDTSNITITLNEKKDTWLLINNSLSPSDVINHGIGPAPSKIRIGGFYEGSIFYGTRFYDYNKIDNYLKEGKLDDEIIDAHTFVKESLGTILHDDPYYYNSLKKIKSKKIASSYGFRGMPYFIEKNGHYISQYRLSSGESMLISLIDFINNLVINGKGNRDLLFLIDEVELALHPSAIDRLVSFLSDLTKNTDKNLIIYFSTHSAELLHRINPKNIFLMENINGNIEFTNPCYPNYAIRNLYVPNGFDYLLLVEDELSKAIVDKALRDNNLGESKLCCVLPAGGCTHMLKLHRDMVQYNTLGVGKKIISIYDGDVKDDISNKDEFSNLPKCFLPIPSIEKYLKNKLIIEEDRKFIKLIGDKYYTVKSLNTVIKEYKTNKIFTNDNNGKKLYKLLLNTLEESRITEDDFVKYLCDDIFQYESVKINEFINSLKNILE